MKLLKKLLVFCLVLSLLLAALPIHSVLADSTEADDTKLQLMIDLGIYAPSDDMEYYNEYLTREEMASILSVFYGLTETSYSQSIDIEDVPANWSSGHIGAMIDNNVMSTYADGLFHPLTYVTTESAVKMLLVMMGYEPLAEAKGGYPNGYYSLAGNLGLLDGLNKIDRKADINRGNFTKLLYNALHTPVLNVLAVSNVITYEKKNSATLLTEKLHIYQDKGVVTALPYMSFGYGQGVGEGKVCIDNTKYFYDKDLYDNFGENVQVYYRQFEDELCGTILSITKGKSNESITVDAEDIVSFENRCFTYMDGAKTRSINLPIDFLLLFNGKALPYYQNKHLMPEQGTVRFCDANNDGVYETVVVTYEVNYHVGNIIEKDNTFTIVDIHGAMNNRQVFDIEEEDYCVLTDRNIPYELSDIHKDEILSIAADQMDITTGEVQPTSSVFRIRRTSNRVQGKLTQLSPDSIHVDGTEYEITDEIRQQMNTLQLGTNYIFHLNYRGKIADFTDLGKEQYYGLLLAVSSKGLFTQEVKVRIYTQEGFVDVFDCVDDLRIDGYNKNQYGNAVTYLKGSSATFSTITGLTVPQDGVWQLVKFTETAEGAIQTIDTLKTNAVPTADDLTHVYTTPFATNLWCDGTLYNQTSQVSNTIATDAIIFVINSEMNSDSCYSLMPYNTMGVKEEVQLYFDADELGVSKVMFRMSMPSSMNRESYSNFMVYEKTVTVADEEGNAYVAMIGNLLWEGKSATKYLSRDTMLIEKGIQPGDIVQFIEREGKVQELRKAFSRFGGGTVTDGPNYAGVRYNTSDLRYGKVLNQNDDYIRFSYSTATGTTEETLRSRYIESKVYIFDTARNKLIQSSLAEVRDAAKYGDAYADTFVGLYVNDAVRALVLYR